MAELYLEDFAVGQTFGSDRLRIEEERIRSFAAEFDPQPFHLDPRQPVTRFFTVWQPVAGILQPSQCACWSAANSGRQVGLSELASMSSAGRIPCGQALSCTWRVKCLRCGHRSRVLIWGQIKVRTKTLNQNGEAVQIFIANLLVLRPPK